MLLNLVDAMTCDAVSLGPHPKTIFVFVFLQTNTNLLGFFQWESDIFLRFDHLINFHEWESLFKMQ
jgi:hypothetical protein